MAIDAPAILGEPITFPNGMKAPNRFLKVCRDTMDTRHLY